MNGMISNIHQFVKQKDLPNRLTSWDCIERRKGNCKTKDKVDVFDAL